MLSGRLEVDQLRDNVTSIDINHMYCIYCNAWTVYFVVSVHEAEEKRGAPKIGGRGGGGRGT